MAHPSERRPSLARIFGARRTETDPSVRAPFSSISMNAAPVSPRTPLNVSTHAFLSIGGNGGGSGGGDPFPFDDYMPGRLSGFDWFVSSTLTVVGAGIAGGVATGIAGGLAVVGGALALTALPAVMTVGAIAGAGIALYRLFRNKK